MTSVDDTSTRLRQKIGQDMARFYLILLKTSLLHDLDNKALHSPLNGLIAAANHLLETTQKAQIQVVGHMIYVNEAPIRMDDFLLEHVTKMEKLTDHLRLREITFLEPVEPHHVMEMVKVIKNCSKLENGASELRQVELDRIRLRDCYQERIEVSEKMQALHTYLIALLTLKDLVTRIQDDKPSRVAPVKRAMQQLVTTTYANTNLMLGLIAMPRYRGKLFNSLLNTGVLTIVLCRKLDVNPTAASSVAFSATLHDLDWRGNRDRKATIRHLMRIYRHDRLAQKRIAVVAGLNDPKGPPASQLISVAAAYERFTSAELRGEDPVLPDEALRRIEGGVGKFYSGMAARLLCSTLGIYPIGSAVELSDGSLAIVIEVPEDGRATSTPIVKLVKDALGGSAGGRVTDLASPGAPNILRSVSSHQLNMNTAALFLA